MSAFDPSSGGSSGESVASEWDREVRDVIAAAQAEERDRCDRRSALQAKLVRDDGDFHVLAVKVDFTIRSDSGEMLGHGGLDHFDWEIGECDIEPLLSEVGAKLSPWFAHFSSFAMPAPIDLTYRMMGDLETEFSAASFHLVYSSKDSALGVTALGSVPPIPAYQLEALAGASLEISVSSSGLNATMLYQAALESEGRWDEWAGVTAAETLPREGEGREDWLGRVFVPRHGLARTIERWKRSGGNLRLYGLCGSSAERAAGGRPIQWIVPGLFMRGYVSLLVGAKGCGKSTLLGELAATFDSQSSGARLFLGTELYDRGVSVIVSGEDGEDFISVRERFYERVHGEPLGIVIANQAMPWAETLDLLHDAPGIGLIVIDPFRGLFDGDEDNSGAVSRRFNELNALAQMKNCAIIASHHLSKNAPRAFTRMLDAVRGSGVFTDRPRVVVGMLSRSPRLTEVAIIKHNIPPGEPIWGAIDVARSFRPNPETLTLDPIGTSGSGEVSDATTTESSAVILAAIGDLNQAGDIVRRTGKSELYERHLPALVGLSRNTIRAGVANFIAAGRLVDGPDGLRLGSVMPTSVATDDGI